MLYLEAGERTGGETNRMSRCKEAERLAKIKDEEHEKTIFTGFPDDYIDAFNRYYDHIQEHGCWRNEP